MHLKVSSAKWRPFYLGLNVLKICPSLYASWLSIQLSIVNYLNQMTSMDK